MTGRAVWDALLGEVQQLHLDNADLSGFCTFPTDVQAQEVTAFDIPPRALMERDAGLVSQRHGALQDRIKEAGRLAKWRETYKGTNIGADFLNRFGCYSLIGEGGAYRSAQMNAWFVYMPARLWYTWHHHPGEEMYVVLAGEAEFRRGSHTPETLREGDAVFHQSNQPHATETFDQPLLAYVVWRNGFETPPVLTSMEGELAQ
ncbi:MAG: dimethylsulfonioproprionate lyase family protein [Paracoccaceae bacterium]